VDGFRFRVTQLNGEPRPKKKCKDWEIPMTPALREELKAFRLKLGGAFGGLLFPSPSDPAKSLLGDVLDHWLLAAD
jgi:hypothetical protein